MQELLVIRHLKKKFGRLWALNDLCMSVPKNSVTAFVGANGAGKTTTFSLIGGFFRPNSGSIEIEGLSLKRFRRQGGLIGLLPQDVLFFESRSLERHLVLFARLAGFSGSRAKEEAARVLKLVELEERAGDLPSQLSHGMKVRFGVAQAIVGKPQLVLLDEPTAGLDPKMTAQFRRIISSLKGQTTIVISSHDLGQLQVMCDYVCMIDQGRLLRQGAMCELLSKTSRVIYRLERPMMNLEELKNVLPEFSFSLLEPATLEVCFPPLQFCVAEVNSRVLRVLFKNAVGVLNVESQKSLEQTFLEETTSR